MPKRTQPLSIFLAASGLLTSAPGIASYGQMNLSFGIFAAIPGAILAVPFVLAEWIGRKLPRVRVWALFASVCLLTTGLAWRASFASFGERTFGAELAIVGGAVALAMILAWMPARLFRVGLIATAAFAWHLSGLAGPSKNDDAIWLLVGFTLTWALFSFLSGDTAEVADEVVTAKKLQADHNRSSSIFRRQSPSRKVHMPSPARVRGSAGLGMGTPSRAAASYEAFRQLAQPSTLMRGVLLFVAFFGGGTLLIFLGVEPLAGMLLSFAGSLPGSVEPPHTGPVVAYWLSYGIIPSLLLAILTCAVWPRRRE